MLVLTRKVGESVFIGDNIEITIQAVKGEGVRIAIEAPKEVQILRKELKEAREVNRESTESNISAIDALRRSMKKD